jgi:hypothetical protein
VLLSPPLNFVAPLLIDTGTDERRARPLEPIRMGREIWCQ